MWYLPRWCRPHQGLGSHWRTYKLSATSPSNSPIQPDPGGGLVGPCCMQPLRWECKPMAFWVLPWTYTRKWFLSPLDYIYLFTFTDLLFCVATDDEPFSRSTKCPGHGQCLVPPQWSNRGTGRKTRMSFVLFTCLFPGPQPHRERVLGSQSPIATFWKLNRWWRRWRADPNLCSIGLHPWTNAFSLSWIRISGLIDCFSWLHSLIF